MDNTNNNEDEDNNKKTKTIISTELIIHILILFILFIICIWDRIVNIPVFPKNFLFLTQIDLYSNIIYYSLYLYFKNIKKKKIPKKLQLLFNFNFCVSFCVFIMYWSMFLFDKETLYKKETKKMVPTVLNILLHGGVFICNLSLILLIERKKKIEYIKNWFFLLFSIGYIGILYLLNLLCDIRVYPFIYGSQYKFLLICISSFIVCLIGHYIYIFITKKKREKNKENNYQDLEMN